MSTGWILKEVSAADLKFHPLNTEIYGDEPICDQMLASVKEFGVLVPLRATKDNVVLSGNRRLRYAKLAKLKTVPALISRKAMSDSEQVVELVESNRQRQKTREQIAREFCKLSQAKADLARARQIAAGKARHGQLPANLPEAEKGEAKEQAAAELGMSRHTAEKAAEVIKEIDLASSAGNEERATALRETLNNGSVSAAHRLAREPGDDATDPEHDESVKDALGAKVPAKLRNVFSRVTDFRGIINRIGKIQSDIEELQNSDAGAHIPINEILKALPQVQTGIKFATPYTECPKCRRKRNEDCRACKGSGWVTQATFDRCKTKDDELWLKERK